MTTATTADTVADFVLEHRAKALADATLNRPKSDLAGEKLRRDLGAAEEVIIEVRDAVAVMQAEGQWPGEWDGIQAVHMLTAAEGLVDASRSRVIDEYGDD